MTEGRSGVASAGRPRRLTAIGAALAAPVAIYFALRTAAVSLSPAAATALPPSDSSVVLPALAYVAADPRQRISEDILSMARRAALASPLAWEPYFIQAKAHEQAGRLDQAIRLMEEARRRRSSFLLTRLNLIAYYQQARRFPDLVSEMDFVLRKSQDAKRYILPELAKLISDPVSRAALATILARNPGWREEFFQVARSVPGSPEDALALLEEVRQRKRQGDLSLERGLYLHRLLQAGDYGRARTIWLQTLPPGERAHHALLFNGSFRPIASDPAFAWTLRQEAAGRAEIVSAGTTTPYLEVLYYGGSDVTLAEQPLALDPGQYRLLQLARSEAGIRSGDVFWSISCIADNRELARLPLRNLSPTFRPSGAAVTVPPGCNGQRLRLVAEPGDISAEVHLQIGRLEIRRVE